MSQSNAPKMNYDQFIAMLIVNAVKLVEKETGRKVVSIQFPSPSGYDNKENRTPIHCRFAVENES